MTQITFIGHAAVEAVKLLKPKLVVPIYYNTFPAIQQDPLAFKAAAEEATPSRVVILKSGESHEF